MVKYRSLFIILFFISCGIKTRVLSNKITVVPVDNKIFKNKIFFDSNLLEKIDTISIYKEEFGYQCLESNFKRINNLNEYHSDSFRSYYKFYSNGYVNSFLFKNFEEVKLSDINPDYDGQRGILYRKQNEIRLDLFTITSYTLKKIMVLLLVL